MTSAEAASFASQFWDRKEHPTKASKHESLATCIDVDLEKNAEHAHWHKYTRKRGHQTTYFVPYRGARRQICKTQFLHHFKFAQECDHLPPQTHTFLKRPFLTDLKKYTHTPPPPPRDEILAHWTKSSQNPGKVPKPTALAHTKCPRQIYPQSKNSRFGEQSGIFSVTHSLFNSMSEFLE